MAPPDEPVEDDTPEPNPGEHDVPVDLVELHEVIEWNAAVAEAEGRGQ